MRLDLDVLRGSASGLDLDAIEEATPEAVTVRGHLRGRPVRVRFLVDPDRDPKPLIKLAAALAKDGPLAGRGLVPVLKAAPDADPPYVVEGEVPGRPLDRVLAAGNRVNVSRLAHDQAAAVAMLAERGLAHLAIEPASIIISSDGSARLGGLGSARLPLPEGHAGRAAQEAYAAPEALGGHAPGAPADVYALALVLCEAAAGRALFSAGAAERVAPDRRLAGWALPGALETTLGPMLASAVTASLDLKPGQRPRPEWLLNAATRALPAGTRYPFALAPVPLAFAAIIALLVSGAMKDIAVSHRPALPKPSVAARPSRIDGTAERHLLREEYREAERLLRPGVADAETLYGNALEGLGRLTEARDAYQRSLARRPDDAFVHLRLGRLWQKLGDREKALTHTRAALRAYPDYPCALMQLTTLDPQAPDGVKLALAADPRRGHDANHLGYALWTRGRHAEAEVYLRRGAEAPARVPGSQMDLARFFEATARPSEARDIALAVNLAVPRADAHALLARVYANRRMPEQSSQALEAALRLDPYTAVGLAEVARTLIRVNSTPERARVLLQRAIDIDPTNHDAWEDMAVVRLTAADRDGAREAVLKALTFAPSCCHCKALSELTGLPAGFEPAPSLDSPLEHYARAVLLSRAGKRAEASTALQGALSWEPGNLLFTRLDAELKRR